MRKNNFMNKTIKLKGSILAGMNAHLAKPLDFRSAHTLKGVCQNLSFDRLLVN
jgi:hypothetical protein